MNESLTNDFTRGEWIVRERFSQIWTNYSWIVQKQWSNINESFANDFIWYEWIVRERLSQIWYEQIIHERFYRELMNRSWTILFGEWIVRERFHQGRVDHMNKLSANDFIWWTNCSKTWSNMNESFANDFITDESFISVQLNTQEQFIYKPDIIEWFTNGLM